MSEKLIMIKYFVIALILFAGCAKERLNGEVEVLEGTWKTAYISGNDYGTHAPINSSDENYLEIRFAESGNVYLYDNHGNRIERGRIITYSSHRSENFPYTLYVNLTIKSNQMLFSKLERINSISVDGFSTDQVMRIPDFLKDRGIDEMYFSQ